MAIGAIVPIYAMIFAGFLARKAHWLSPEADASFVRVSIDLTLPCFIIYNMLGNEKLRSIALSMQTIALGMCVVGVSLLAAWAAAKILGLKVGSGERTFTVTTGTHNYGFFIIALVAILFSQTNPDLLGLVLTHNVGCDLVFWSVGVFLLSGRKSFSPKVFMRGPVAAVFFSLALIWTGLGDFVPEFVLNSLKWIGFAAIPLNLMMFGTLICDMLGNAKIDWKCVLSATAIRMLALPCLFFAAASFLPIAPSLKALLALQTLPPCGVTAAVLSKSFGGKPELSVQITLATCIAAVFTMPLWLGLCFGLIGPGAQ